MIGIGYKAMTELLRIPDNKYPEISPDAPARYLRFVDSTEYTIKPLHCPACDAQRIQKRGKERRNGGKIWHRWQCSKCDRNWFTEP